LHWINHLKFRWLSDGNQGLKNHTSERLFYTAQRKAEAFFDVKNKRQGVVVSNQALSDLLVDEDRYRANIMELFSKGRRDEREVQIKTKGDSPKISRLVRKSS
jgi:hypothetical protein